MIDICVNLDHLWVLLFDHPIIQSSIIPYDSSYNLTYHTNQTVILFKIRVTLPSHTVLYLLFWSILLWSITFYGIFELINSSFDMWHPNFASKHPSFDCKTLYLVLWSSYESIFTQKPLKMIPSIRWTRY